MVAASDRLLRSRSGAYFLVELPLRTQGAGQLELFDHAQGHSIRRDYLSRFSSTKPVPLDGFEGTLKV